MENTKQKRLIKGLLLDGNTKPKVIEIEDELHEYYKALDCDMIEIVVRRTMLGKKKITIVCDEEGLLKNRTICPSGILLNKTFDGVEEVLLGKIFVCNEDEEGNLVSLTDEDIRNIKGSIIELHKDFEFSDEYGNVCVPGKNCLIYTYPND